ncbi:MAG: hypothetical protein ACP5NW_00320 [Candidatus Woesearchaeota archaeon]
MSDVSESRSLNSKLTIYDAFGALKESISDNYLRNTLEGAVIIASPSILNSDMNAHLGYSSVHDSRYKFRIAQTVRDTLMNYSNEVFENPGAEVDRLLSLPAVYTYPGYGQKGLNLPFVVLQVHDKLNDKQKPLLCRRVGEITEKGLKSFYANRGFKSKIYDRPDSVAAYLIAEYEFFTRITAETSNRARKLF